MVKGENGIIYEMPLFLLIFALAAGIASAENPTPASAPVAADFPLYLGLAVPIPDIIPEMSLPPSPPRHIPNGEYALTFEVDQKGRVKKNRFPSDSAWCYGPVEAVRKQIHFRFLGGACIDFPVKVPAKLCYANEGTGRRTVRLRLPISADSISDSSLLDRFFADNRITLPAVTMLPPIYYQLPPDGKPADCQTITALVAIDETGALEDLSFPFPEGAGMTHPLQSALINGAYRPAAIKGKPFACRFLITFRVFDNLRYPIAPLTIPDTARVVPMTAKYFMTTYLNPRDIAIFPLPRSFADGVIRAGAAPRGYIGKLHGEITISPEGTVGRTTVRGTRPELEDMARQVFRLTDWYPARNNRGEAIWFTGYITIEFDGTPNVVYIPEWVK